MHYLHDRYDAQRSCRVSVEQGGKSPVHNLTRKMSRNNTKKLISNTLTRERITLSTHLIK